MIAEDSRVRMVVPTLGRRLDWLEASLRSIRNQDCPVRIVIVAPDSRELRELARRWDAVFVSDPGVGLSAALNLGFSVAGAPPHEDREEFFGWLGDDDVLAPGSISRAIDALDEEPSASLVLGRVRYIDGEGRSKWVVRSGAWAARYAKFGQNFMSQPGSLFRKKSFINVGGLDSSLKNSMDQDLFLKLARVGRVVYVPQELAAFRVHAGSISSKKGELDERSIVGKRYRPEIPKIVQLIFRLSDRVLLSVHSRIPHPAGATVDGVPYYVA